MIKRSTHWLLVGLLLVLFLIIPNIVWAGQQSPWMWPADAGQWIGDQFEKGGDWIEKKLGIDDVERPIPKPDPQKNPKLIDAIIPPTKEKVGRIKVMYQQHPLSHYQLDYMPKQTKFWNVRDQIMNLLAVCAHEFNNSVWNVNVAGSRLVMWLINNALSLDIVTELSNEVGEGLKRVAGIEGTSVTERGIYGLLLPLMVVIGGIWLGYKTLLQEDEDRATRGLIYMVIMIPLFVSFFYHAKGLMQTANQVSSELTKSVMAVTTNIMQPNPQNLSAEEAGAAATNNLWQVMIHKPYLLLQFGSTTVNEERVDRLLSQEYQLYQESPRKNLVKQEVDQGNLNMTAANNGHRFLLIVFLSLFNVAIGVIMVFFALAMLGYQLYFLAILLISPIVFTWAIVPAWQEIASRWISEALRALLMKFAWGVLLAMLFSFSSTLFDFTEEKSYLEMMICQWALVLILFWKRKTIFQYVTAPADYLAGGRWKIREHSNNEVQKMLSMVLRYTMGGKVVQAVTGKVLSTNKKE